MKAGAAIDVAHVTKTFGRLKALDDVSFAVEPGGVTALLGANGAGKSTLFQILTGLFVADAGTVRVFGADFAAAPAGALARMGIVFQAPVLDLDLSVRQNLAFQAGLHGLRGRAALGRIEAVLDRFGLAGELGRKARDLSGGTRRKVEIARALLTRPPLLLLDEPSTGLDTQSRRNLVRDLCGLAAQEGTAVLWSTHLVGEVEAAARVVVLHRGRVTAVDSPAALLERSGARRLEDAFLALAGGPAPTEARCSG